MNDFSNVDRMRGIMHARAAADDGQINQVLHELTGTFAQFRQRNDGRLNELETAVNSQAETISALRMNGGGVHAAAGLRGLGGAVPRMPSEIVADMHNQLRGMPMAAMSTQVGPDGGFTVPDQVDSVLGAVLRDISPLRSLCRVVTLPGSGSSWYRILSTSGSQSAWVGEEEDRADTANPKFAQVEVPVREIYALPQLTNALLEDSAFDLNAWFAEDVAGEFALAEGQAFVSGDGIKRPRGFTTMSTASTADASRAFGTLQYVPAGGASAFDTTNPADRLHNVVAALRASYRAGPGVAWLMNSATANTIRKFKDGQGNYLWSNSIVVGQPDRLLGYPVAIDEGMPDIGANAFPVAFGNWQRGYAIVDKPGIRLIVDRYTKKGWTKPFFYKRVGGGVVDSNAIKLLKIATS